MAVASIVDYLKSRNMDSSYGARKNLASQYGITGYSGTAQQNMSLLKSLQQQSQKSQAAGQQPQEEQDYPQRKMLLNAEETFNSH